MFFLFMVAPVNSFAAVNEAYQQSITVKGKVTDRNGEPLPGVSIILKGTTIGVMTDADGKYSINVPDSNATLAISYMGFIPQEHKVGNNVTLDVVLIEQSTDLDEVIVVGYGVQKKVNLTGAVASIGSDKLANRPTPNLSSALAGLAPGVRVTQGRGNPGDESVSINIRGLGSINGSSPMILVDGVVADMTIINPDDVESINFLKDAASAAIYGSRAANGVVLVTTKKGKREKPKVTVSALFAQEKAATSMKFLSDMPLYMELHNTAQRNSTPTASSFWYSDQTIADWRAANANPNGTYTDPTTGNAIPNWLAYPNTDWATEMFKPTFYHRYNLSISGGNEASTYLLSASFQDNPGSLENTGLQRFNIRANVETKINDFLTVGTQTYGTKEFKDPGSISMTYLLQAYPGQNPKYNGLFGASEDPNMTNMNNVLQSIAANGGKNEYSRINTTWFANAKIWNGLSVETKFNYSEYQRQDENYSKNLPRYRFREGTETPVENIGVLDQATSYRYSYSSTNYTADLILRYNGTFGDHDISAFAGYEQYYAKTSGFRLTVKGLLGWNVTDINSGSTMDSWGSETQKNDAAKKTLGMLSYFGRFNYAYKGKYLFEANVRSDGSSRFAPDHRWGTFPSFSAGWRISEEPFFAPLKKHVNDLKLKASYGVLGNQVSGYYDWQSIYSKVNSVFNESVQNGLIPNQLPNFQMSWETTATSNIGIEAHLLRQRLLVEFDYFTRKTSDMLISPPVYQTMGNIKVPKINAAEMKNSGIDLNIGWNDKVGNLRYSVNANISYSTNEITNYKGKLKYEEDPNTLDVWGNPTWRYTNLEDVSVPAYNLNTSFSSSGRVAEGHMVEEFYLCRPYSGTGTYMNADGSVNPNGGPKDGMIRSKADLDWVRAMLAAGYSFNGKSVNPAGAANLWYGTLLMADANGDGRYGASDDYEFTGKSSIPKWVFGFNMSAEWKGVDLSLSWAGRLGSYALITERGTVGSTISSIYDALPADALSKYYSYDAVAAAANGGNNDYDPATDPDANYTAKYPRLLTASANLPSNTYYLFNTSYLKLKSLQIGYTLPKKWLAPTKIGNLRVFVTGENLLTIKSKDFPGVDPELGGSIIVYPIAKMFSGGVTVTF
jgi:TonB-linked SusC/RagA family outer membrane protein